MDTGNFIRGLTECTGDKHYKCITRWKISFETLTHFRHSRAAPSQLKSQYDFSSNLWAPETIAGSSEVPHLAMTATKLTLEWTKVIFGHDSVLFLNSVFTPVYRVPDDPDLHPGGPGAGCDHPGHLPHPTLCRPDPDLLPQPGEHRAHTEAAIPTSCQVF